MNIAGLIDHTLLKPHATRDEIRQLCIEAAAHGFAAVCVNGIWVRDCAGWLAGLPTVVASVAGFPLGASTTETKCDEAQRAIDDGAREVDFVINIGAAKSGAWSAVADDTAAVIEVCRAGDAVSKVIIETCYLTDDEKVRICELARELSAGFVKTSTGFGPSGATVEDVALMRRTVGPAIGVKASGGIRDRATVEAMVAAGATRIGTSAGVRLVEQDG